jgi:hypothetical protein
MGAALARPALIEPSLSHETWVGLGLATLSGCAWFAVGTCVKPNHQKCADQTAIGSSVVGTYDARDRGAIGHFG